jgi:hypothetical protein
MDGAVKAGTLPALIERLTLHDRTGKRLRHCYNFDKLTLRLSCRPFFQRYFLDDIPIIRDGCGNRGLPYEAIQHSTTRWFDT